LLQPEPDGTERAVEQRRSRWNLVGREVRDGAGRTLGPVIDTYPWDGGGEPELVVVRLPGLLGGPRMLRLVDLWDDGFFLRTAFARWQVEDSPELSIGRHSVDDPWRAKSYWLFEEPAGLLRTA
jgi:hypothetical protein